MTFNKYTIVVTKGKISSFMHYLHFFENLTFLIKALDGDLLPSIMLVTLFKKEFVCYNVTPIEKPAISDS